MTLKIWMNGLRKLPSSLLHSSRGEEVKSHPHETHRKPPKYCSKHWAVWSFGTDSRQLKPET